MEFVIGVVEEKRVAIILKHESLVQVYVTTRQKRSRTLRGYVDVRRVIVTASGFQPPNDGKTAITPDK